MVQIGLKQELEVLQDGNVQNKEKEGLSLTAAEINELREEKRVYQLKQSMGIN